MSLRPGPRNLITDVDGILVGNAQDARLRSGVSVVLCETPAMASVDMRGGAPGTRDTDLLDPACRVERVDGICLSGGSAFGLAAADGVIVPIVPGAILFDLLNGGDKKWEWPPYRELAYAACGAAGADFTLGNHGAGLGARAGNLKGGLGSASAVDSVTGLQVGALVAVNAVGYTTMGHMAQFWAWALEQDGEFGGVAPPSHGVALPVSHGRGDLQYDPAEDARHDPRGNTTIAVVATNARLTKAAAKRFAIMAQDGFARAIRPSHTPTDGDTVFALATGKHDLDDDPYAFSALGTLAADCLARAVARGVYNAETLGTSRSWKDVFGS